MLKINNWHTQWDLVTDLVKCRVLLIPLIVCIVICKQEKLGGNKFNENGENSVARTPCNYFNQHCN
jgi:hypothetical protein